MLYIVGRISDHKIVEQIEITSPVYLPKYLDNIAVNNGGSASDYSALAIEKGMADFDRLRAGDQWVAQWTGDTLTGVDFSYFDSKYFLKFESDRPEILADSGDSCTVTVTLEDSEGNLLNDTMNGIYIPVQSPLNIVQKKIDIVDGTAKFDLRTSIAGEWVFPLKTLKTLGDFRIKNVCVINALMV